RAERGDAQVRPGRSRGAEGAIAAVEPIAAGRVAAKRDRMTLGDGGVARLAQGDAHLAGGDGEGGAGGAATEIGQGDRQGDPDDRQDDDQFEKGKAGLAPRLPWRRLRHAVAQVEQPVPAPTRSLRDPPFPVATGKGWGGAWQGLRSRCAEIF